MPLNLLAEFVKKEKHLPNIPPASEIQKVGLNMTQMQIKLLEKVEELTLYTLEQHQAIQKLEARLKTLEGRDTTE
jgi:hypothetical protein